MAFFTMETPKIGLAGNGDVDNRSTNNRARDNRAPDDGNCEQCHGQCRGDGQCVLTMMTLSKMGLWTMCVTKYWTNDDNAAMATDNGHCGQ